MAFMLCTREKREGREGRQGGEAEGKATGEGKGQEQVRIDGGFETDAYALVVHHVKCWQRSPV